MTSPFLAYDDGAAFRLVELRPGVTRVGHASGSHIRVDAPGVSARHAAIVVGPGGAVEILDERSLAGTVVNGERVSRRRLRPGDIVRLGRLTLGLVSQPSYKASVRAA